MSRASQDIAITAYTLVSALGRGRDATLKALHTNQSGLTAHGIPGCGDTTYLGKVFGLDSVKIPAYLKAFDCDNARLADVALDTDGFSAAVEHLKSEVGAARIAVVLGTSTSGARAGELAFAHQDEMGHLPADFDYAHTHELTSISNYVRARLGLKGLAYTISTACTSSTKSFVDGAALLRAGWADAVVVGGVDTLCECSVRGFYGLELLSPEPCCPNDVSSRGISIGEAAGFALLQRKGNRGNNQPQLNLLGYGESSDAHHMSLPHPEAVGACFAMERALASAGISVGDIDYVNLHGTGSVANDRVEDMAVTQVLGTSVPVSSTKGWTGHTLGAAGIVDSIVCFLALEEGLIPQNLNLKTKNPNFKSAIVETKIERSLNTVLTNNFGFGGNNCSLVFGVRS